MSATDDGQGSSSGDLPALRVGGGLMEAPTEYLRFKYRGTSVATGKTAEESWLDEDDDGEPPPPGGTDAPDRDGASSKNDGSSADGGVAEDPLEEFMKCINAELENTEADYDSKRGEIVGSSSESENEPSLSARVKRPRQEYELEEDSNNGERASLQFSSELSVFDKLVTKSRKKVFVPEARKEDESAESVLSENLIGIAARISSVPVDNLEKAPRDWGEMMTARQSAADNINNSEAAHHSTSTTTPTSHEKIRLYDPNISSSSSMLTSVGNSGTMVRLPGVGSQQQSSVSVGTHHHRFVHQSSTVASHWDSMSSSLIPAAAIRKCMRIKTLGLGVPRPVLSYMQWKMPPISMESQTVAQSGLTTPQVMRLNDGISAFNTYVTSLAQTRVSPHPISSQLYPCLLSGRDVILVSNVFDCSDLSAKAQSAPYDGCSAPTDVDPLTINLPVTFSANFLGNAQSMIATFLEYGYWDVVLWHAVLAALSSPNRGRVISNMAQPISLIITPSSAVTNLIEYRFLHLFESSDSATEEKLLSYVTYVDCDTCYNHQALVYIASAKDILYYAKTKAGGLGFFSSIEFVAFIDFLSISKTLSPQMFQVLLACIQSTSPSRQLLLSSSIPLHNENVPSSSAADSAPSEQPDESAGASGSPIDSSGVSAAFRSMMKKPVTIHVFGEIPAVDDLCIQDHIDVRFTVISKKANQAKSHWVYTLSSRALPFGDVLVIVKDDAAVVGMKSDVESYHQTRQQTLGSTNSVNNVNSLSIVCCPTCGNHSYVAQMLSGAPRLTDNNGSRPASSPQLVIVPWANLKVLGTLQFRTVVVVDSCPSNWFLSFCASAFCGTAVLHDVLKTPILGSYSDEQINHALVREVTEGPSRCYVLLGTNGKDENTAVMISERCVDFLEHSKSSYRQSILSKVSAVVDLALTQSTYRKYKLKGGQLMNASKVRLGVMPDGPSSKGGQPPRSDALPPHLANNSWEQHQMAARALNIVQIVPNDSLDDTSSSSSDSDDESRTTGDGHPTSSSVWTSAPLRSNNIVKKSGFSDGPVTSVCSSSKSPSDETTNTSGSPSRPVSAVLLDPEARAARKKANIAKFRAQRMESISESTSSS